MDAPGGGVNVPLAGDARMTEVAAIVPSELGPSTMTGAPSVMSLRSAPATFTLVDAVVVTVTG